jgi:hypothetical protein
MKTIELINALEQPAKRKPTPIWIRRGIWEPATLVTIALGLFMLMQPFAKVLFTYSFIVLLAGVVGYSIAGKLPE